MGFCIVSLYPATLLTLFVSSRKCTYVYVCARVCVNSLGFYTDRILSLNENNFTSFQSGAFSIFTFHFDFLNNFYVGLKHI